MSRKTDNRQTWTAMTMVLQFSLNMIVPIFLCTFLGIWIGDKTDINWMVIPFFFLGALGGFNSIYKMSKQMIKDADRERRRKKDAKKNQ